MDYPDDSVSVSEDDDVELDAEDDTEDEGQAAAPPPAAAATAPAPAAAAANGVATTVEATQAALLSGELSTHAALLQLQVAELLSEVALCRAPGRAAAVQQLVAALAAALWQLPAGQQTAADDAGLAGFVSGLGLQPQLQETSLDVSAPVAVQLVGSWALGAAAAAGAAAAGGGGSGPAVVDVAVQLPASCLHRKDLLNYKYHAKRALYLSALSAHLAGDAVFGPAQQQLAPLHGDPCRPVLLLHLAPAALAAILQQQKDQQQQAAAGKKAKKKKQQALSAPAAAAGAFGPDGVVLRLLPVIGLDAFELGKLAPDRNNIRRVAAPSSAAPSSGSGKKKAAQNQQQQGQDGEQQLLPTPHYNAAILQDMLLLLGNSRLQQAAAAAGPKFIDALLLLKTWATFNGLTCNDAVPAASFACHGSSSAAAVQAAAAAAGAGSAQADGFTGHLLAVLLSLAVQEAGSVAGVMSAVQLLRAVLQLLADKQSWSKGQLQQVRDSSVPAACRQQQSPAAAAAAAAAAAVPGAVSKDHARLVQKLQQQLQLLPAPGAGDAFRKQYEVTVLDSSGHLNLAAAVSKSQLQLAQQAASRTLAVLGRTDLEPDAVFAAVFRPQRGLAGTFDYCWSVELPAGYAAGSSGSNDDGLPGDQHPMRLAETQVEGLVRQALTSRALLVKAVRRSPQFVKPPPRQQQQQPEGKQKQQQQKQVKRFPQSASAIGAAAAGGGGNSGARGLFIGGAAGVPRRLTVGAVVDAAAALRLVDVGPPADDAAAAGRFRELWGEKSELRRFADGKINEAVVWEGIPPGERHRLPDLAVQHILLRHLPPGTVVTSCSTALDPLLYPPNKKQQKGSGIDAIAAAEATWQELPAGGTAAAGSAVSTAIAICGGAAAADSAAAQETAASRAADAALDSLAKQLRGVGDVALKVIGVQPLSPVTRHTCCFYPRSHPLADGAGFGVYEAAGKVARVLEPIEVMVQLEGSGRMPSDPAAFAKMKAALGVQLAAALTAACGAHVTACEEALEVLWQGFAFKLLLYMDRDNPMLAAITAGSAAAPSAAAASTAGAHMPRPVLLSRHHGLVAALEAAHAAYGPTVRLAKRWLGLQLLLGSQVSEEAVELLVGGAFQGPSSSRPPASRISGFLRFLHLVSSHPWSAAPLVVDPAGEVGPAARRALMAEFDARRAAGTAPAMFLATPYDLHSSIWTSHHHPGQGVAHHLVSLARSACHQLSLLLLLGPDAPPAQQQLQLLPSPSHSGSPSSSKKQKKARHTKEADDEQLQDQRQLLQLEVAALAQAWRSLSGAVLAGFDAWFVLRKEALPFSGRVDSRALQQLEALLALRRQRQQLAAAAGEGADEGADGEQQQSKAAQSKKRRLQEEQSERGGAVAALQHLLLGDAAAQGGWRCEVPKESRAILRSIPEQVLATKPVDRLRSELLVGFNPISQLLQLCSERYSHLATFCADPTGCFPAIGLKWHPQALLPAVLRPALAQGLVVLGATAPAGVPGEAGSGDNSQRRGSKLKGKKQGGGASQQQLHSGLVVPNVPQVLSEVCEMGAGLVEEVVLLG